MKNIHNFRLIHSAVTNTELNAEVCTILQPFICCIDINIFTFRSFSIRFLQFFFSSFFSSNNYQVSCIRMKCTIVSFNLSSSWCIFNFWQNHSICFPWELLIGALQCKQLEWTAFRTRHSTHSALMTLVNFLIPLPKRHEKGDFESLQFTFSLS